MVASNAARPKKLSTTHLNNNTPNYLCNSQFSVKSSDNVTSFMVSHTYCNKSDDSNHTFNIYHQNIQGLKGKINAFLLSLFSEVPHLFFLSQHHLKYSEIDLAHVPPYELSAKYCRTTLKCGGVCIYIHKNIKFSNISLLKYCKEQDLEIAAVKLKFSKKNVIAFYVYRAATGDFDYFLKQPDITLNSLHDPKWNLYCVMT
jgi:hypothetical protein